MSYFITFEGIEGSGKSTQISLLADWLKNELNTTPIITREPGGCPIANQIRGTLLDAANDGVRKLGERHADPTIIIPCRYTQSERVHEEFLRFAERYIAIAIREAAPW